MIINLINSEQKVSKISESYGLNEAINNRQIGKSLLCNSDRGFDKQVINLEIFSNSTRK